MKIIFLFFFLLICCSITDAQTDSIIYYRKALQSETDDNEKVDIMNRLGFKYLFTKVDSSLYYGQEALKLSQLEGYKKGEMSAYELLTRGMRGLENYSEALKYSLLNLKMSESLKDTISIFFARRGIMWTYAELGDRNKSFEYASLLVELLNSHAIKNQSNGERFSEMAYRFLGNQFETIGNKDSALKYYNLSHVFAISLGDPESLALNAGTLADYFLVQNNIDSAFTYYHTSIVNAQKVFRNDILNEAYIGIAGTFLKTGNADSALIYARKALEMSSSVPDTSKMKTSAKLMSGIFKFQNRTDSAYKYLKYVDTLNELLVVQDKIKKAQEFLFAKTLQDQQVENAKAQAAAQYESNKKILLLLSGLAIVIIAALLLYRNSKQKQNDAIKIKEAYDQLKSTQVQLIQSEKMASLGELTAGIAHEIQNPLNFVNNFSDVNTELIGELKEELAAGNMQLATEIADDIQQNEAKINHHGKRADAIVKGMLQHSRTSTGEKEATDINKLADEYLRLAYQGMRAKDNAFNTEIKTEFDASIGNINIVPQDIGRVLLNLYNNAFYAVNERQKAEGERYNAEVSVTTKKINNKIEIRVADNGRGIPEKIKGKIFQPFFTTKPTGSGTGLGLSLSYDIIKAHGGQITGESQEGEGTAFIIVLPA